jgi:hypothetical protein
MSETADPQQRKSRRTLLLVAAVCIAPFVGSFLLYFFWQPSGRVNYGDLVEGAVLPALQLPRISAERGVVDLGALRGKWLFVTLDSGACADACNKKLWQMRQVRLTQGKHLDRIERAWLVTDDAAIAQKLHQEYEGMHIARARGDTLLKALPAKGAPEDHIWIVDPLGNVILRYPKDADPSRIKKDLARLLRVSRIG